MCNGGKQGSERKDLHSSSGKSIINEYRFKIQKKYTSRLFGYIPYTQVYYLGI